MAESNFIDYVKIYCRSGKGGAGSTHFHREKFIAKGGPDGGDGGKGGHIILRGNKNYWTLIHLKYSRHVYADDGGDGSGSRSFGKDGEGKIIDVPLGTVAFDAETGNYLCDITADGQEIVILKGGRGGQGNWHFRTATKQTPRYAQPGEPRIEKTIVLQLKLLADVGLVGFPNAGKSTLLSVISSAKPEIADYPFTTLVPNLGIVLYRNNCSFVVADIPGIIEGAAEGKGLGLRFLRHIERNSILLFMIPADTNDIKNDYNILLNELKCYNPDLENKQKILAITKCDMLDNELIEAMKAEVPADVETVFISSITGLGLDELKDKLWAKLLSNENQIIDITHENLHSANLSQLEDDSESVDNEEPIDSNEDDDISQFKGIGWDDL
ncbi:MAG: GTPase ObgE [Paludibacter sp.]|jgi:GTP-binding protein|nr:GTPase ObgE [Paludibacter sp.]